VSLISIRTTRHGQRKVRRNLKPGGPLMPRRKNTFRFHHGRWRKGRFKPSEPRKGSAIDFFGRKRLLFRLALRRESERRERWRLALSDDCREGRHQFEEDACVYCGTSFWRWAFCEAEGG